MNNSIKGYPPEQNALCWILRYYYSENLTVLNISIRSTSKAVNYCKTCKFYFQTTLKSYFTFYVENQILFYITKSTENWLQTCMVHHISVLA